MYRRRVRVQEKGEASARECAATTRHLFQPPQKWHHAEGQKSRNPRHGKGKERTRGLSSFKEKQACVCCPYVRQQSIHSGVVTLGIVWSLHQRKQGGTSPPSVCRGKQSSPSLCDVVSLLQAGREGARCEKGQRERRRQPASWGGLGKTCGQLQAVPTLGCTPSSSAAGWCPLRRQTQTGCFLCLLHM